MEHRQQTPAISFFGLLGLVLITLKLAEIGAVATWPWWLVLTPLWFPVATIFVLVIGVFLVALVSALVGAVIRSLRKK